MAKTTEYSTIRLNLELIDKIRFMSSKQGKSQTQFLTEVMEALFDVSNQFTKDMLMLVDTRGSQALFTFGGRSNMVSGSFSTPTETSDLEVDARIKREISKKRIKECKE